MWLTILFVFTIVCLAGALAVLAVLYAADCYQNLRLLLARRRDTPLLAEDDDL